MSLTHEIEKILKLKGTDQWMKNPLGDPTILSERQWIFSQTSTFKTLFGDWTILTQIEKARKYVEKAASGAKLEELEVGRVLPKHAERIKELTGIDVTGAEYRMNPHAIRHTLRRHGDPQVEGRRIPPQIAVELNDLSILPLILNDPDKIELGTPSPRGPSVRYVKEICGAKFYYVEVLANQSDSLVAQTLWKTRARGKLQSDFNVVDEAPLMNLLIKQEDILNHDFSKILNDNFEPHADICDAFMRKKDNDEILDSMLSDEPPDEPEIENVLHLAL